jgi:tRNA (cytidine32/uridine32-2'-O)-methyltransferase
VSAIDVLEGARVVQHLDEAIADSQFVVGTSALDRRIPWPILDARGTARRIAEMAAADAQVTILFGREDRGLTTEELQRCHLHCQIPTHEDYTSLNLAMAVQIVAYELRMLTLEGELPATEDAQWDAPFASVEEMERFYQHLEAVLVEIDFLDPKAPRQLMPRLRRMYGRMRLDEMEVNILRGILTETQKTIRRR